MQILLVDDHTLFREALLHVLRQLDANVLAHEAANVAEASYLLTRVRQIDLILLDIDLPDIDGLTALPDLRERAPTVPIVVLSGSENSRHLQMALDNGAVGYIPKSCSGREMLHALQIVLQGDIYVPPRLLSHLGGAAASEPAVDQQLLTARQIEVLALIVKGLPNKSIARTLNLAEGTVKLHVAAILRALDARNRTQAVTTAVRLGLVTQDGGNR